ncbi:hypothetical protein Vadar_010357 [Vaccinium darrowii]|uniref:Uncharacterized protein n=1 Tax=Vaccinium darrowii TaxID=229202 RepID=A0ACB7XPT2_9ERIC|nr:hypothetical protein Vadar_010357 [Vaccinium darrowii]
MTGGIDVSDLFPSLNSVLRFLSPAMRKLNRLHRAMDEILNKIINERKQNPEISEGGNGEARKEDILDELLKLTQMAGGLYKLDNVKAVILDIFFAGTDTSSATVEWAMSELVKNPEVMKKTQAEVRKALRGNPGKKRIDPENQENQDLKYLNLVIKETLRLHPPFPLVARQCSEEHDKVAEYLYRIPIKTKVLVNVWAMGRNRDYWGDDAESFRPERFESNPIWRSRFQIYSFWGGDKDVSREGFGSSKC